MTGPDNPAKSRSSSVAVVAEKARTERLLRLKASLARRLENPIVAVDVLMGELGEGEPQTAMWEELHAAAIRDGAEAALADAYQKSIAGPRMKRLKPQTQADVLMHAADYFQGVLGDAVTAEHLVERVLTIVPGHVEAYGRLERRLEKLLDSRRILELYASVAAAPPKPVNVLATQAFNRALQLSPKDPLPDDACKQLLALVPVNPRLLDALETHCRATKRFALACALIEQTLLDRELAEEMAVQRRRRLLDLYLGEAASPTEAIAHVELLLQRDPSDDAVFKVAERLLSTREAGSRAAAAMQAARRARGY
jgi:hypothetical protein